MSKKSRVEDLMDGWVRAFSTGENVSEAREELEYAITSMGRSFYKELSTIRTKNKEHATLVAVLVKYCKYVDYDSARAVIGMCRGMDKAQALIALDYFPRVKKLGPLFGELLSVGPVALSAALRCVESGSATPSLIDLRAALEMRAAERDAGNLVRVASAIYDALKRSRSLTGVEKLLRACAQSHPIPDVAAMALRALWRDFSPHENIGWMAKETGRRMRACGPSLEMRLLVMETAGRAPPKFISEILGKFVMPFLSLPRECGFLTQESEFPNNPRDASDRQIARCTIRSLGKCSFAPDLAKLALREFDRSRGEQFLQMLADLCAHCRIARNCCISLLKREWLWAMRSASDWAKVAAINMLVSLVGPASLDVADAFSMLHACVSETPFNSRTGVRAEIKMYALSVLSSMLGASDRLFQESREIGGRSPVACVVCDGFMANAFSAKSLPIACHMVVFLERNVRRVQRGDGEKILGYFCSKLGSMGVACAEHPGFVSTMLNAACLLMKALPPAIVQRDVLVCEASEPVHSLCDALSQLCASPGAPHWLLEACVQTLTCAARTHHYRVDRGVMEAVSRCGGGFLGYLAFRHKLVELYGRGRADLRVLRGCRGYDLLCAGSHRAIVEKCRQILVSAVVVGGDVAADFACAAAPMILEDGIAREELLKFLRRALASGVLGASRRTRRCTALALSMLLAIGGRSWREFPLGRARGLISAEEPFATSEEQSILMRRAMGESTGCCSDPKALVGAPIRWGETENFLTHSEVLSHWQ